MESKWTKGFMWNLPMGWKIEMTLFRHIAYIKISENSAVYHTRRYRGKIGNIVSHVETNGFDGMCTQWQSLEHDCAKYFRTPFFIFRLGVFFLFLQIPTSATEGYNFFLECNGCIHLSMDLYVSLGKWCWQWIKQFEKQNAASSAYAKKNTKEISAILRYWCCGFFGFKVDSNALCMVFYSNWMQCQSVHNRGHSSQGDDTEVKEKPFTFFRIDNHIESMGERCASIKW